MTTVTTRIVKIGNSQGVRIPKVLLEQVNFGRNVQLEVRERQIIIRDASPARSGWAAQFEQMAQNGDDKLFDEAVLTTEWDDEEWAWS